MPTKVLNHVVVEPQTGDPGTAPWVVICHGLGDSHRGWLPIVPYLQLPQCGFVVVDAPNVYYDGFSWFRIPGITNPMDTPEDFAQDFAASRQVLRDFLVHLGDAYGVTADRLFLMGFSQGCQMVLATGMRAADRYRGIIGISGRFGDIGDYPAAFGPAAHKQDYLVTHGYHDPLLPLETTREQIETLRDEHGLNMDWREYVKEHSIDPDHEIPAIRAWLQERI